MKVKLGEKILKLRKQHGMSQENLAERLNLSRQTISRWEVGSAQPDVTNILQLSKLFEVTADYLLNDDYVFSAKIPLSMGVEMNFRPVDFTYFSAKSSAHISSIIFQPYLSRNWGHALGSKPKIQVLVTTYLL